MGNYRPFLQGPLPVANYTRIIIPGRFWTRPPSTKSTRMASSATPLHDSLIELAIPDAHAHAIKWYLNAQVNRLDLWLRVSSRIYTRKVAIAASLILLHRISLASQPLLCVGGAGSRDQNCVILKMNFLEKLHLIFSSSISALTH